MHSAASDSKSSGRSYDIFRKDALGNPIWVEAVSGFEAAKERALFLSSQSGEEHLLFDSSSQNFIDLKAKAKSA